MHPIQTARVQDGQASPRPMCDLSYLFEMVGQVARVLGWIARFWRYAVPMSTLRARIGLLLCLTCLGACTSAAERLAGWYVTRKIDSYVDLTGEQHKRVRQRVDAELDYLRRTELPRLVQLLRDVRHTIGQGATEAQVAALQARGDALIERAAARLIPQAAALLAELDDRQIAHFERRMRETHREVYEAERLPADERREHLDGKLIDSLESLVDDLREEQARTILRAAHALPDDRPKWARIEAARITEVAQLLRRHPGQQAIAQTLQRMWETRYESLGPGRDLRTRRAEQRRFLLLIDGTLSQRQRAHAVEEMSDHIQTAKRFALPPRADDQATAQAGAS